MQTYLFGAEKAALRHDRSRNTKTNVHPTSLLNEHLQNGTKTSGEYVWFAFSNDNVQNSSKTSGEQVDLDAICITERRSTIHRWTNKLKRLVVKDSSP